MTRLIQFLTLVFLLQAGALAQQSNPIQRQSVPLERYLAPDGTLSTPAGFSGALDPAGWRMTASGPSGAPRFAKVTASVPEDSLWDDQFGWDPLNAEVNAIAVSGSNLYAGGYFTKAGGVDANHIARWNGATWDSLGPGPSSVVNTIKVVGTDVYAGGSFSIAKWNGTNWSTPGLGVDGSVYALEVDGSDIYVVGDFPTIGGGTYVWNTANWNGTNWSGLGTGVYGTVKTCAFSGTDLYIGGLFLTAGQDTAFRIARWRNGKWKALGSAA